MGATDPGGSRQGSVLAAIEHKQAGGTLEATPPAAPPPTEDMMATLQKSLEARRPLAKAEHAEVGEPEAATERRRRHIS